MLSRLSACAPLPALIIGIVAMRDLGVSTVAWSMNIAATALGFLIWAVARRLPPPERGSTRALLAAASVVSILLPFAAEGMLGVYRWVSLGSLRLHAAAIVTPLLILCVAAEASHRCLSALAIAATGGIILALQPDAAQTTSFAAACAFVFACAGRRRPLQVLLSAAVLLAVSIAAFARPDPLRPVAHVEGIFSVVASRGAGPAALATLALLLLPLPFVVAWYRHRHPTALALGVYIAMTLLAPVWGTFPVPVMGYGASPILGYFIALVVGLGGPSPVEDSMQ